MRDGMPGAIKALKLVGFIEELGITPEEVAEIVKHHRMSETTHGLLWGDIANFGRETIGLKLIGLLCAGYSRISRVGETMKSTPSPSSRLGFKRRWR